MNLQDQCCTREQGQRLVELGVNPEATFYHMPAKSGPHGEYIQYGFHGDNLAPAFNVAELGELLPDDIGNRKYILFDKTNGVYRSWCGENVCHHLHEKKSANEAEARAALLIYLLENNLITCQKLQSTSIQPE